MKKIIIDKYNINEVPIMAIYPEDSKLLPLIIYAHGLGGNKDSRLDLGCLMAEAGFYFVAFDAQFHGDRADGSINKMLQGDNLLYPLQSQIDFIYLVMKTVEQNSYDIREIIDYYSTCSKIDTNRIGIMGTSMGGCTAFYVAATNPLIKVAIPMMASPMFVRTWDDYVTEQYSLNKWVKELDAVSNNTEEIRKYVEKIDPVNKIISFAPKPLLILGGEKDSDVSKAYLIEAYGNLRQAYTDHSDKLELKLFKGVEHSANMLMYMYARNWFNRYL